MSGKTLALALGLAALALSVGLALVDLWLYHRGKGRYWRPR